MKHTYTDSQIKDLARLAAADYASTCEGPTIRGRNGEKEFRGRTKAQRAKALDISVEKAEQLGLSNESMAEVALRLGLTWAEAQERLIDLATATFDEMSEHWRNTNIESAKDMIELMESMGGKGIILAIDFENKAQRLEYGSRLHQLWLEQPANSWAKGGELDRPFADLDPAEQDKDIQQLVSLQKWLRAMQD